MPAASYVPRLTFRDTANLATGSLAEASVKVWAQLRLTRECLCEGDLATAQAELAAACRLVGEAPEKVRATGLSALDALGADFLRARMGRTARLADEVA